VTDDLCMHELAPGTCSLCSGREKPTHRGEQLELATEPHLSTCHDCGAEIVWVRSERDKPMPIDAELGGDPDKARFRKERAEYRADIGKTVGIVHFVRDNELEANVRPLYACHFDTCPARKDRTT
jgi:hypothetical protein